jgi:uncharacterized protein HemY
MEPKERLKLIEEMLASHADDPFLNYAAALEFKKLDEPVRSIAILEGVIKKNKEYLGAYYQLGKLYEETNKLAKAKTIYRKGREVAKKLSDAKTLGELTEALLLIDEDVDDIW